ncbi:MAG: acyl-CoA thioesterase [Candidatus Omnitrophica bacterium CG07_land_8_20_14_0_80_42_15]|uniref:Acyl-CoA thioesterase n=1 Tax=Candidatus Aquitaenariimonas noxiae TaxID=1974741 RepID=A0A2J0KUW5_9BACT|nr:MAG: acyl-CoA thioesterase [Candidatus Omnitrophica bacterium CG07_land_8_20_14_0_80_42_15]
MKQDFKFHETTIRVRYAETDQMGVVYYANYLVWFEVARTEYFRNLGIEYSGLEKKGIYLVVAEANCRYKAPLKYDDQIRMVTILSYIKSSSLGFKYEIFLGDRLIAIGSTTHAFVNKEKKPVKIPPEVFQALGR